MSSDDEIEHLADGLSDTLITGCQHELAIPVTSRNSTFVYKNQPVAIPTVAEELDVAYVLEGSVQGRGDAIRVNAQLIRAHDDTHLWAAHFDKTLTDAFAVEDELCRSIVGEISEVLAGIADSARENVKTPWFKRFRLTAVLLMSLIGAVILATLIAVALLVPAGAVPDSMLGESSLVWIAALAVGVSAAALFLFFFS